MSDGTPFLRVTADRIGAPGSPAKMPFRATNAANWSSIIRIGAKMAVIRRRIARRAVSSHTQRAGRVPYGESRLTCLGYSVGPYDGILDVTSPRSRTKSLASQLGEIAAGEIDLPDLIRGRAGALISEKFHHYLRDDLLLSDALSRRLDLSAVPKIAKGLCSSL